jgi:hypothetical protein
MSESGAEIRLWIDDLRPAPDASWTIARSSAAAIGILSSGRVVRVSFDHDLGGSDTAMRVIEWLEVRCEQDPTFPLPAATVHSANPVGAARLRDALAAIARRRAGRGA